ADSTELTLMAASHVERFTWSKAEPQDPYTNIQISMFDPSTFSDEVTYTIRFFDAASVTRMIRFQSDNDGTDSSFTITHADLYDLVDQLSHSPVPEEHVVWFVTATDQLYITESSPPSHDTRYRAGFYLTIHRRVTPGVQPIPEGMTFTLHPNYPNPFNPGTEIPVELHVSGHCWLQVLDLMG
ncbi:MAG: hypothetical protein JXA28_00995, partial [Bacteroidetes bacterium]|nr:hypothetical protein [Bacteroidota bacterium]